jgi:hypothetical protein
MSGCCVPQNYGVNGCGVCGTRVRFDGPEASGAGRRRSETQERILARNRNVRLERGAWRNLDGSKDYYVPTNDGIQDELW